MKTLFMAVLVGLTIAACGGSGDDYCDCGEPPVMIGFEIVSSYDIQDDADRVSVLDYARNGEVVGRYFCNHDLEFCEWTRIGFNAE